MEPVRDCNSSNSGGTADLQVRPERIRLGRAFFVAQIPNSQISTNMDMEACLQRHVWQKFDWRDART